jgi:hypothetical protein
MLSVTNAGGGTNNPGGEVGTGTNTTPQLASVADRIVHAGSLVVVTNSVIGSPTNVLTFSLDPGAPPEALISPTSGRFTWLTSDAEVNSTNAITVRVTDDSPAAWSDAKSFNVTVVPRPLIAGISINNGVVSVAWSSLVGQAYRLEYTSNLTAGDWSSASPDIVASGSLTSHTNAFNPTTWQFYRVRVLP